MMMGCMLGFLVVVVVQQRERTRILIILYVIEACLAILASSGAFS